MPTFNVVSIATTTGYASTDYNQWPIFAPVLMLFLCGFTTCAGSTGGGIKMIRGLILLKQARREFTRILHPRAVNPVIVGGPGHREQGDLRGAGVHAPLWRVRSSG